MSENGVLYYVPFYLFEESYVFGKVFQDVFRKIQKMTLVTATCETMTERTALSPTLSSRRLRMHESWAQGAVFLTSWYSSSKRVSLMAAPYFTPPPDIHILDNSPTRPPPLSLLLLLLPLNKSVTSRTTEKKRVKMPGHYGT